MSFLGMGRPQPSSEEKIGMMENEIIAMSDLHNRFVLPPLPFLQNSSPTRARRERLNLE